MLRSTVHEDVQVVSEYDQEMPQSHTADQPTAPNEESENTNSHKTSGRQSAIPHKDDCKTRKDTKLCITKQGTNTEPSHTMGHYYTMIKLQNNHRLITDSS